MQIKDAIEEWIDEMELNSVSKETIRAYKNNLRLFDSFINNKKEVEKITKADVKGYIKTNKDRAFLNLPYILETAILHKGDGGYELLYLLLTILGFLPLLELLDSALS